MVEEEELPVILAGNRRTNRIFRQSRSIFAASQLGWGDEGYDEWRGVNLGMLVILCSVAILLSIALHPLKLARCTPATVSKRRDYSARE